MHAPWLEGARVQKTQPIQMQGMWIILLWNPWSTQQNLGTISFVFFLHFFAGGGCRGWGLWNTHFSPLFLYDMWAVYRKIIAMKIHMWLPLRLRTLPGAQKPWYPLLKSSSPSAKDNCPSELFVNNSLFFTISNLSLHPQTIYYIVLPAYKLYVIELFSMHIFFPVYRVIQIKHCFHINPFLKHEIFIKILWNVNIWKELTTL